MITAIILAAGRSLRMGQPKMLLPWRDTSVLGQVITTIQHAGIQEIVVVTGGARQAVEKIAQSHRALTVHNAEFESEEMLGSIQCGLRVQGPETRAVLICLGDQPQVEERSVRSICAAFQKTGPNLVVPSFRMRRGHPWLVARPLWDDLLQMKSPQSPRDFLNAHAEEIEYAVLDTDSIIADLDTPEDYLKYRP